MNFDLGSIRWHVGRMAYRGEASVGGRMDPAEILWTTGGSLLGDRYVGDAPRAARSQGTAVGLEGRGLPSRSGTLAAFVSTVFRISGGERHLMQLESDTDVLEFRRMEKAVRRDRHKMHAFVRFRKTAEDEYIAWYRPDHRIVRINAHFFVRRFGSMKWAILTPDESAYWDTRELRFGPGVPRSQAPQEDELEQLWLAYYASIFNPAR